MRVLKIAIIFIVALFSVDAEGQIYTHPRLDTLRAKCDSLDCPEKYTRAYRMLSEDLYLPLKERIKALEIAESISKELADKYDLMAIYAQRGRIYRDKGRYAESLKAFGEGVQHTGYKNSRLWLEQEGWFLTGYGMLLYQVHLYSDALQIFEDCAAVMQSIDDDYGEAVALNNIALCLSHLDKKEEAEKYFLQAYEIRERIGQKFLLTHSLLYLARLNRQMDKQAKADSLLELAVIYSEQAQNFDFIGDIYCEWAEIAFEDDDLQQAALYLEQARQMDYPFRDLRWLKLKVELFRRLNLNDSLAYYLDTALVTVEDFGNIDLQVHYLKLREKLCRELGKAAEANATLQRINQLNSRLISIKDTLQVEMMSVQGEFYKNRLRIDNLEASNLQQEEIIKGQNRTLLFLSIIALILLIATIVVYRIYSRLQLLSERLNLLNQRSRLAADQMPTVVIALDYRQRLIFLNKAARLHFKKYDGSEMKEDQEFLEQLQNPKIKADWKSYLKQVGEKSKFQNISSRELDGRHYYHMVSLSEMRTKGRLEGTVAVLTDITSNQEKSLELSHKTLALERANEAKDKILSLLAHDLKEGVVSSSELTKLSLDPKTSPDERLTHMQMIHDSLGRTKTLLFKTLDWVKHQSEGLHLQRNPLKLKKLCDDLIHENQSSISNKKIKVENELSADLEVITDVNALRVVLRNLLANAIKFVAPSTGHIRIYERKISAYEVEIYINDNGKGMSPQQLSDLMANERIQSTKGTLGEEGTGMGLQLCKDFLFNMGSTLQVKSSQDKGTIFYFKLTIK